MFFSSMERLENSEMPEVAGMILMPKGPSTMTSFMVLVPFIKSLILNFGTMPSMISMFPRARSASRI